MRLYLLSLIIITSSSITSNELLAGPVFSWLDENGVMHFTDKKPTELEVKSDKLTTKTVEVTNILESEDVTARNVINNDLQQVMPQKDRRNVADEPFNNDSKTQQSDDLLSSETIINEQNTPIAILELSNKMPVAH